MSNPIPAASRRLVEDREQGLCLRCGGKGTDWHHRRSRSVRDGHTHCGCNGVLLCRVDHAWAHGNPALAQAQGWIVSRYVDEPSSVAVVTRHGMLRLNCDGSFANPVGF